MPRTPKRSVLTADQQEHERARMMRTTSKIVTQIDEYITTGTVKVAGKACVPDATRLKAWRLCLDRTVPAMSSKEITHKNEYESLDNGVILDRLAKLVSKKPELAARLQEALGGKVIQGEVLPREVAAPSDDLPQTDTLPDKPQSDC